MLKRNTNFKLLAILTLLFGVLMPVPRAHADNGWEIDLNAGDEIAEASSVTITMGSGTANAMLFPESSNPNKAMAMIRRTVSVAIGATDGYTIKVSGEPNLVGKNANNKIPSITANTTLAQMNNQWGWYSAEGDVDCNTTQSLKQMNSAGETISSGALSAAATKNFTMCFGAKVDTTQAADSYSGTVVVSAVAEPRSVVLRTFGGITTMQEMTPAICKAANVNDTAQLTDTRDGKKYWVTKLLDGNCWMSQNLALNITTDNVKALDSDVINDWVASSTYPARATVTNIDIGSTGIASYTWTYSWDLGNYVMIDPTSSRTCGYSNSIGLSECPNQFTNVSGWTASSDPNFYKNNGNSPLNNDTKTYDAHYLVGNYYQWNAATAGTGATTARGAKASSSVCPKGWILPSSGDDTSEGSFYFLFSRYGVNSNTLGSSTVDGYTYDIARSPLFFVRGGVIHPSVPTLSDAGEFGYYWSSRASVDASSSSSSAYYLRFYTAVNAFTNNADRHNGTSLRCLVLTP